MNTKKIPGIFIALLLVIASFNLRAQYALQVTHDTTICQGQSVQLNVSGGTTYTWTPSGSLSSTTIANPVATPTQTTTYVVTSQITTGNLVTNGDFSAGNTGFTTHYVYEEYYDTLGPQHYTVGSTPNTWNNGYSTACTPRGSDVNMFIADGSLIANVPAWCETLPVYPNSTYYLTGYFQSLDETNIPTMQWMVNNVLVGNPSGTPLFECLWEKIGTTAWNSGTNTSVTFCIADNLANQASGDDFALDDISITATINLTDTVVVTVVQPPVVNLGNDTSLCTGQTLTLNATSPNSTYSWSNGATTSTISVNSAGTYKVQVNNGCVAQDSIIVSHASNPAAFSLGNDTAYCGGFSRVLATGYANTVWSTSANGAQITVNSPGTYWATETNQCGATSDTIIINQNTAPLINLGNDTTLCTGQTLALNATYPSSTYLWSNNSTASNITVNSAGLYWVQVNNGCIGRDSITVAYSSPPAPFLLGNDTGYCGNFSRVLTTGNVGTIWSTSASGAQITVNSPGTYWASETNQCGVASDTIVISQYTVPVINLGNDTTLCMAQTLTLNATYPSSTYLWSNNSTASGIVVNSAGLYWVQVSNGCTKRDSIIVSYSSPPAPFSLGSDTSYCGNFSRVLTTGNTSTVWSTNTTASQITVNTPGTFWATETNQCGIASDTIVLTQTTAAVINLGNDTTLCTGQTLALNATYPSSTYLWSNNSTGPSIVVNSAGLYWVRVSNGCITRDSITVAYASAPTAFSLGSDSVYCGNFSRVLSTGYANTLWSTSSTSPLITVTTPGSYWATETNQCGSASDTIHIGQTPVPVVSLGADTAICSAQTVLLDAGNPGATYSWSNNTHAETLSTSSPGIYIVTVTNGIDCSATASVVIGNYSVPLSVTSTNTSCGTNDGSATSVITNGRGPYQYIWSTNATTPGISGLASGPYDITVTDANGCTASASASVGASGANSVSVTASSTLICPNDTAQLCATTGFVVYNWSNSDTTPCISTTLAGNYSVTVTDGGNCTASSGSTSIQVRQPPTVTVSVNGDTLNSYSASSYQWYLNDTLIPGATASTYVAQVSGNYTVVISDSHGCTATSSVVHVIISGINNVLLGDNIKVYPNPLEDDNWMLQVDDDFVGGTVEIFDVNGREIYVTRISTSVSELDFNSSRGIYFMRITAGGRYFSAKLVRL